MAPERPNLDIGRAKNMARMYIGEPERRRAEVTDFLRKNTDLIPFFLDAVVDAFTEPHKEEARNFAQEIIDEANNRPSE